jgi:hypothetical protein
MGPDGCLAPGQTGRLTVGRNITFTLPLTIYSQCGPSTIRTALVYCIAWCKGARVLVREDRDEACTHIRVLLHSCLLQLHATRQVH